MLSEEIEEKKDAVQQNPIAGEQRRVHQIFVEVCHDPRFWLLAGIVFCIGLNSNTIISQLQPFFVDAKYDTATAAWLLAGVGLIRMAGSSCMGWLSDIIGRARAQALSAFISALGVMVLLTLPNSGGSILMGIVFVLFYGFGTGGMSVCYSAMSADIFGGRNFGAIMSSLEICFGAGGFIGPPAAGFFFDFVGNYNLPFSIIIVSLVCVSIVCLVIFPKLEASAK